MAEEGRDRKDESVKADVPDEQEGGVQEEEPKRSSCFRFLPRLFKRRKGILCILAGSVLMLLGWAAVSGHVRINGGGFSSPHVKVSEGYYEEPLQSFFIPLPADSEDRLLVIEPSAVLDGVASILFKKMELEIRNALYRRLVESARKEKNLREETSTLERRMSRMLQNLMGRDDLYVKIRKIKVY